MERNAPDGKIELRLDHVHQLFETKDPYPFRERDLAKDADEYICDQAKTFPHDAALQILVHLPSDSKPLDAVSHVAVSIPNYFKHRTKVAQVELSELFRLGRRRLLVGMGVLGLCLVMGQILPKIMPLNSVEHFIEEGLIIIGWVALWRPMEIFLCDWWPIGEQRKLYQRLSEASVQVQFYERAAQSVPG